MAPPVPNESSSCDIGREPLAVHIRCAEAQARAASRQRAVRAAVSALVGAGGWALRAEGGGAGGGLGLFLLTVLLIGVHVRINRRWWQYTLQQARLWWRMHGKG